MKPTFRLFLGAYCLLQAAGCLFVFFHAGMQERAADRLYSRAATTTAPLHHAPQPSSNPAQAAPDQVNSFSGLREAFPDLVAWISGPDLDYPVVQGENDTFYLNHLADGTPNPEGAIFLGAGAPADFSGDISCLYGHSLTRGTMFSCLERYRDPEFCQQNPTFRLKTPEGVGELRILGVCLRDGNDPYPTDVSAPGAREEFLTWVREHTQVALDIPPGDHPLVILSTCAYDFENARLAVVTQLEWKERKETTCP